MTYGKPRSRIRRVIIAGRSFVRSARVAALFEPAIADAAAPEYLRAAGSADSCGL